MNGSENETSSASGAQSDDELSFLDLVTFVRRHRLALLGGALMGGTLGLAVAFVLPAQWEAVAQLRVAQLGGSAPVEQPLRVVERVTQKSFGDDALRRMGVSPDESNPKASLLRNSLKVKVEKSDLVGVRVRGASPDEAARFMNAVIAELVSVHAKMAEPTLQRWRSETEEIDVELKRGDRELERLRGSLERRSGAQTASMFQAVLTSNILLSRETELRGFRERKRALQEQLSPERAFPTSTLGRIEVSTRPVFPKKPLFAVGGLVIGLLMGVLLSVVRGAGTRRNVRVKN